ncbi:MAG: hypothetical protein IJ222_09405 [Bacteroidales bacterium]|nr:hypothetical protein [Bacteroidales bacterium]
MVYALTGFMGCGKSSIGREAARLAASCSADGLQFLDLDAVIEEREGRSIPEIFAAVGEPGFRKIERAALQYCLSDGEVRFGRKAILLLSLGGGTLTDEGSRELISRHCRCIYLRASIDTLVENLSADGIEGRPMLAGAISGADDKESRLGALRERISTLMAGRAPIYEAAADHIIDIDGLSYTEAAEKVLGILRP